MTPVEWIWWLALVGLILVVAWQEWEEKNLHDELDDEQRYSEWLEEYLHTLERAVNYEDTTPDLMEYKRELWHTYHEEMETYNVED